MTNPDALEPLPQPARSVPPPLPAQPIALGYAMPALAVNPRPTCVTVLGVIGIILGILGLLGPLSLLPYFVNIGPSNPVTDAIANHAFLKPWTIVATLVGTGLSLWLLVLAIGAMKLWPGARVGLIRYATVQISMLVLGQAVVFLVMIPLLLSLPVSNPAEQGAVIGGIAGGVGGGLLSFIYPICLLVFMRRPHVVAAFAAGETQRG
jgi:hypothetical protein